MWARASSGILVALITCGMWLQSPAGASILRSRHHTPENERPGVLEGVSVIAASPDKDCPDFRSNFFEIASGPNSRPIDMDAGSSSDNRFCSSFDYRDWLGKGWRRILISDENLDPGGKIKCRGNPGIFQFYMDAKAGSVIHGGRGNATAIDADISPKLRHYSISGLSSGPRSRLADLDSSRQPIGLNEQGDKLKAGEASKNFGVESQLAVEINKFPIKLRFFSAVFCFFGGFCLVSWAGYRSYDQRRLFSTALIGGGILLGLLGWILILTPWGSPL